MSSVFISVCVPIFFQNFIISSIVVLSSTNTLKLFIQVYALFLNIELVSDIFVENKFLIQIRNLLKLIPHAILDTIQYWKIMLIFDWKTHNKCTTQNSKRFIYLLYAAGFVCVDLLTTDNATWLFLNMCTKKIFQYLFQWNYKNTTVLTQHHYHRNRHFRHCFYCDRYHQHVDQLAFFCK